MTLQRTCVSGYATATVLRQARATHATLTRWQSTAMPSSSQCTAARWSTKTWTACVKRCTRRLSRAGLDRAFGRVGVHEGIAVVRRRVEGRLDGAGARPADQVPERAGLVVRPGRARAAERLLADDRSGGLVVDVEV